VTDQFLGDRTYCLWQWEAALANSGFDVTHHVTPFFTYKDKHLLQSRFQYVRLTNFICRKLA
jgi:hypothetical protein